MSGISNLPAILKAPIFFDRIDLVNGILCYVIKDYGTVGISALAYRIPSEDNVHILFGDWAGNPIDLESPEAAHANLAPHANKFIEKHLNLVINIMHQIKLTQAQFFFAVQDDQLILTDIQISANKMTGPGMLRDIFANVIPTQEVIKIEPIDSRVKELILSGSGSYSANLILKPSKFRINDETQSPLYVRIAR